MNLTRINLHHSADDGLLIMFELFITERFSVMAVGHCVLCQAQVSVEIPFLELYEAMPHPESENKEAERMLAHSLGVKLDEEAA